MAEFSCVVCGESFTLAPEILERYPGWSPRHCRKHRSGGGGAGSQTGGKAAAGKSTGARSATRAGSAGGARGGAGRAAGETHRPVAEVMASHSGGPSDGIFTDGSCEPNPGPGGWGLVRVRAGEVVTMRHGHEPQTTNNRMEMLAVIHALELLTPQEHETIWSDSQLVVKTLTEWAQGWERAGWKRKSGPIANLELVQQAWALAKERPHARLQWIAAHSGHKWNEVADSLSTAWRRGTV